MRRVGAALLAVALSGCGRGRPAPPAPAVAEDRAVVSLERVVARSSASEASAGVGTLPRGAEVRLLAFADGFTRVSSERVADGWVPLGAVERLVDREAREARAKSVTGFPSQTAEATERCPILLAPDYGAPRWGYLEAGERAEALLADHDFLGIRLARAGLAFVPARSVRLLPAVRTPTPSPEAPPAPAAAPQPPAAAPDGPVEVPMAPGEPGEEPALEGPLAALPPGAQPPVLLRRVDPRYPETARRQGIAGEVVLRVVVEDDGAVGDVDVVAGAPAGLTEAAAEAVRAWRYEPARVDGRPVSVYKTIRVRFSLPSDAARPAPTRPL